jgi:tetrahydromethanopterin S-methyltransferase subunit B
MQNAQSSAPTTPTPLSLPDDANASEVQGQYGIGVAGLILGTVFIAALVVGVLYVVSRRSWSTSQQ